MAARFRIESLLSARLFLSPQLAGERIYFLSNLSGRISLYAMDLGGGVPEPLLPPQIALQNPELLEGRPFVVLPALGKILVMIDQDGDENYQPMFVPLDGGWPEPAFGERFAGQQVLCLKCNPRRGTALLTVDPRTDPIYQTLLADLDSLEVRELARSKHGCFPIGADEECSRVVLADEYTFHDRVLYLWDAGTGERRRIHGTPMEERTEGETVAPNGIGNCFFTPGGGLLFTTALFDDRFGLGHLDPAGPEEVRPVAVEGTVHEGPGQMERLEHLAGDCYALTYNIDGCSWVYEGRFDESALRFRIEETVCGRGRLEGGVLQALRYDRDGDRYAASFSTATSPSQLYLIERDDGGLAVRAQTRERILDIPQESLSAGEDVAYDSHDGLRIPARLYLPSPGLGFEPPYPVIFYIHGGPQSQERPDFTWFSMPLIQFFTLSGMAVYVPNVRGSTGYGLSFMKRVDRDECGQDRLDHVHAFGLLREDPRLDLDRAGVMGRSYGGQMTLTLAGRHPELWKAACDMFGPYNLLVWLERLPETWKTYFHLVLGHPERDRDFLIERSPSTWLHQIACPLLVIQGANDPRVVEAESRDLVEDLRAKGKQVEYLLFEDEGHDVIKFDNRVACYDRIVEFFRQHL